jgi:hypothetical protein
MANAITKFGLPAVGMGLLSFMVLFVATGGVGSCATESQMAMLFLGLAGMGIGSLVLVFSLLVFLIQKYKAKHLPKSLHTP